MKTTYDRVKELVATYERDLDKTEHSSRPIGKLVKMIHNMPDGAPEHELFRILGVIQGLVWALEVRNWGEIRMESAALGTTKYMPADRKFRKVA